MKELLPVQLKTGAGAGGGALTAISAAKAGVPSNPSAAIEETSSFFMTGPPNHTEIYHTACRGLLPVQHSEGKNRVEARRTVERPHSQLPFTSSEGGAYAQDVIGSRTNSLDDCCSDKFESRCCWRGIRRWDRACGRWASRRCGGWRYRRYLGETVLGTAE
jgi:hypothetical protein